MRLKITTTKEIPLYMARDRHGVAFSTDGKNPLIMSDEYWLGRMIDVEKDSLAKPFHKGPPIDWDSVTIVKLGKR